MGCCWLLAVMMREGIELLALVEACETAAFLKVADVLSRV
jgi:hypothetical protein